MGMGMGEPSRVSAACFEGSWAGLSWGELSWDGLSRRVRLVWVNTNGQI